MVDTDQSPVSRVVIPVAGYGTRLLPLTRSVPKELLPLGRKPVLQHVIDELAVAGVSDYVLVTCDRKASIREYFEHESSPHKPLFVNQLQQRGLGDAVLCARDLAGNAPFFIALGDAVIHEAETSETLCQRMHRLFNAVDADAAIAFHQVPRESVSRYGVADVLEHATEHFTLRALVEKPAPEQAPSLYAIAARYLCKPALFDELARTGVGSGGEIQLTDALQGLINDGAKVIGVPLSAGEKRYDIGNVKSYYSAVFDIVLRDDDLRELLSKTV